MSCLYHKEEQKPDNVVEPTIDGPGEVIPHPPERFFTGNLGEIEDNSFTMDSIWRMADVYGPIYTLNLVNRRVIVISNYELINEVCDEKRFEKTTKGVLETLRVFIKNGLFTAYPDEHEWYTAHRTLVPGFGPIPIRRMFDKMVDIASQMVLRWDRLGADHEILGTDDFTIKPPEFAVKMAETLVEAGRRTNRLAIENAIRVFSRKDLMDKIHFMWGVCDKIVADRKANPQPDVDDILKIMLTVRDPVSGELLDDELIRYEMATFLVAGHETTSGTFNFLFYNLLTHPEKMQKCYQEVDEVLGDTALELSHLPKLKYIEACIRETLRYFGPIPVLFRHCKRPTVLGGKYKINPDSVIMCNLKGLHHDSAVYGEDANEFRPERFLNGGWEKLPPNAWKPFGTGPRACIGRALAEQEMLVTCALIFQRFVVELANPNYELRIKQTLTIKPQDFKFKVRRRPGKDRMVGIAGAPYASAYPPAGQEKSTEKTTLDGSDSLKPLAIFYGGNTGTCKSFGEDIQTQAPAFGFSVPDGVRNLDDAVEALPTDRPVLIITASYEGQPPDNAKNFVAWLESRVTTDHGMLKGVSYSVLGAGNKEWASTYHRIPNLVDDLMSQLGAERLFPAGMVDVSEDIVGPFEDWKAGLLPVLRAATGATAEMRSLEIKIEVAHPDAPIKLAGTEISTGLVLLNKEIVRRGVGPQKKHMEVLLPPGVRYRSGDYLVVLPYNPRQNVLRVLRKFALQPDDLLTVSGTSKEYLSANKGGYTTAFELIGTRVELATPASQRQLSLLAEKLPSSEKLNALATDEKLYRSEVLEKRVSIIDVLEDFPDCPVSFSEYVDMLVPLAPRQYSISSSPLAYLAVLNQEAFPDKISTANGNADDKEAQSSLTCSITYDVFEGEPALSGHGNFNGVASSYLSNLTPGSRLRCFVRSTNNSKFRLPTDPKTPVVMVAAGTGVAPMRAFIQERAAVSGARGKTSSTVFGPATLYYGCRDHSEDFMYQDELQSWQEAGVVKLRSVFSKRGPAGDSSVGKHVDDIIWEDREALVDMFKAGARILVCGSASRLGRSTHDVCLRIYMELHPDASNEEAEGWLLRQKEDRYLSDVFG